MLELALALSLVAAQQEDSTAVTRDLERIEQRLGDAWKNGECEAWGAIVAPEWSVIHVNAEVITRSQALQMCRAPQATMESFMIDEVSVRSFGDAAVVTGRTRVTMGGATPTTVKLRFTDFFVRRAGRWQVVASQATRLAE